MDKALDLLTRAAEKIGLEAARVWPDVVRLHWVMSLAHAVIWLLFTGVLTALAAWSYRRAKQTDEEGYILGLLATGTILVILALVALIEGPPVIGALFAPEASLIRSMVGK